MKRLIVITILSIMLIITKEDNCNDFGSSKQACESVNPGVNKICRYTYDMNGNLDCLEISIDEGCQYDINKEVFNGDCTIKEESDGQTCHTYTWGEKSLICQLTDISCYDLESSKEKCLKLKDCGYDEKRGYNKCFPVQVDSECKFENNECTISTTSFDKTCSLIEDKESYFMQCKVRNIECSDFNQDSTNCPKAKLQGTNKVCSYDNSRSGNKCFIVSIADGCKYNSENKECTGLNLSHGKICDLDYSENPVNCTFKNIHCNDLNNDSDSCQNVILPDRSKRCIYNSNRCVEKEIEAKCEYDELVQTDEAKCTSTFSLKLKCELNNDKNGCIEKNPDCIDFTENECDDVIFSDSNKKCKFDYESAQCSEDLKECSDFYNENQCISYKPQNALAKCVWSKECKEKTCKTTSTENCGSFTPNDSSKQCSLNEDKTECEEIRKSEEESNGAKSLRLLLSIISLLIIL